MPQPDSGDNCCDCPSRASPCDNCGGTGACCFDGVCEVRTQAECEGAGGVYHGNGTPCVPNPCCTTCNNLFNFGCQDGDGNCRIGPENCDECVGAIIPCDSLWETLYQYCITCPGSAIELCAITRVNPVTCESTVECVSNNCCADCIGTVQMVADRTFPCPTLSPPP